jgi:hypothetical protein
VEQIRAGVLCQKESQESFLMPVKGTVSRDFRLQVFFHSPSPGVDGGKFAAGINDISGICGKFSAGVDDTG